MHPCILTVFDRDLDITYVKRLASDQLRSHSSGERTTMTLDDPMKWSEACLSPSYPCQDRRHLRRVDQRIALQRRPEYPEDNPASKLMLAFSFVVR